MLSTTNRQHFLFMNNFFVFGNSRLFVEVKAAAAQCTEHVVAHGFIIVAYNVRYPVVD